jgi:hypothetical protein
MMAYVIPTVFFDAPQVIDTTVTPIPGSGSAPLQVIADSGINYAVGINYTDTTGDFIGVYSGAAGSEVLICVIGNGLSGQGWLLSKLVPHSRVSLRSMKAAAITNGLLTGVMVGI